MTKRRKTAKILLAILCTLVGLLLALTVVSLIGCDAVFEEIALLTPIENDAVTFEKANLQQNAKVFTEDGNFDVLQISDVHICCSIFTIGVDKSAVRCVRDLVAANKPDLVVLTGDLVYPLILTGSINNRIAVRAIGEMMESFGIPWAVVYGNHDAEKTSLMNKSQQSAYYSSLPHCLFSAGDDDLTGQGNYVVELVNSDNTLNTALFMLDSNSYEKGLWDYSYVKADQVEWYKNQVDELSKGGKVAQSVVYCHIPLYQYNLAYAAYEKGEATLLHGVKANRSASSDEDYGKLFDAILEKGSTKAVFCGHDHTNNWAIRYRGIVLGYGMSVDYVAFPFIKYRTEQRGGNLLQIDKNGNMQCSLTPQDNDYLPIQFDAI